MPNPPAVTVEIADRSIVGLIKCLAAVESGVWLVTVHKKRIVKLQLVDRDNLLTESKSSS